MTTVTSTPTSAITQDWKNDAGRRDWQLRLGRILSRIEQTVTALGNLFYQSRTVAQLPATATLGAKAFVTDSTVVASGNFGAIVAGTGADAVPVYWDGANWRIG